MKSLRLRTDGLGNAKLESLALPFVFAGPTATDDDHARTPRPELATAYGTIRLVRRKDGDQAPDGARHLLITVSGTIEVRAGDMRATLSRGDILLVDHRGPDHAMTCRGDCRLVLIDVADGWEPEGVVAPALDAGPDGPPLIRNMYVDGDQARFRELDGMFDDGVPRPVERGSFFCLSPDSFGDWHTEEPTSLVVVLTGLLEFEVGGDGGAVEVFGPGDVCLVQDHHGQGHITRTRGETRFVAVVVPRERAWSGDR